MTAISQSPDAGLCAAVRGLLCGEILHVEYPSTKRASRGAHNILFRLETRHEHEPPRSPHRCVVLRARRYEIRPKPCPASASEVGWERSPPKCSTAPVQRAGEQRDSHNLFSEKQEYDSLILRTTVFFATHQRPGRRGGPWSSTVYKDGIER